MNRLIESQDTLISLYEDWNDPCCTDKPKTQQIKKLDTILGKLGNLIYEINNQKNCH